MIRVIEGDVLAVNRGIIVHGCNTLRVFGAGIALQIKRSYPEAFDTYSRSNLTLGHITYVMTDPGKYIVNAITQKCVGIGKQVSYDAIEECFERVVNLHGSIMKTSGENLPIVFPAIGAGLGGGSWPIIEKIIDETVPDTIEKVLYLYKG